MGAKTQEEITTENEFGKGKGKNWSMVNGKERQESYSSPALKYLLILG